ncbi:MAG: tetratricopeptide repeat protein [Betaproteobacteria bacterium]|nr:tetratricopeptide repeat protein [Betaproteobacteria bacterium]MDE2150719.1 tetratricopeptide repeat protein [Betaproteobacteria bacterium]
MRHAVLAASLLAALASAPWARQAGAEVPPKVAAITQAAPSQTSRDDAEQQARWFYSTLTGEIAARTGHPDVAYAELLRAARDMDSAPLFEQVVQVALGAHQPELALSAVGAWLERQPGSERAQAWRVQLLLGLGRDTEAAPAIQHLLAMSPQPQRPETVLALGGMFLGMQDAQRALALARRSLAPYAALPQTQAVLAQLQVQAGELTAGLARAARALKADPALRPAALLMLQHYKADPPRADALVGAYLAAEPDDDTLRMGWIDAATQQQRDSVALAQCELLARRRPELAQVWLILGSLQQQMGRYAQAEHSLARFLSLSLPGVALPSLPPLPAQPAASAAAATMAPAPAASAPAASAPAASAPAASAPAAAQASGASGPAGAPAPGQGAQPPHAAVVAPPVPPDELAQVYLALSSLALHQGADERAGQWLQHIPSAQRDPAVVLQQAKLLAAQGRPRQAVERVRALPRATSEQRRRRLLALSELLQAMHEPAQAYAALRSGMGVWGHDADYAYETAMAAQQAGQPAQMLAGLRRVVKQHPEYQPALNALGYSLADQGRELEQARRLVEHALRLSPGNPFVMDSLGWVEFRQGRLERAQKVLEQAYAGREDPEIGAHLAEVLWRRGQHQRATELLRSCWKAAPQDHGVLEAVRRLGLKF